MLKIRIAFRPGRWFWAGCAALFLLGGTALFLKSRSLLSAAQGRIQSSLAELLPGHEARIEKISTNFFNALSLETVELSNPGGFSQGVFLRAEKVKVSYNLRRLIAGFFRAGGNAAEIEIVRPSLFLINKDGLWNFPRPRASGRPLPSFRLLWKGGRVEIRTAEEGAGSARLDDLSGELDTDIRSPLLRCGARGGAGETLTLEGSPASDGKFRLQAVAKNLPLLDILRRSSLLQNAPAVSGRLSGTVEAASSWEGDWKRLFSAPLTANFKLESGDLRLSSPAAPRALSLAGEISLSGGTFRFRALRAESAGSSLAFEGALSFAGGAAGPAAAIDGRLTGGVKVEDWIFPADERLKPQGTLHFSLRAQGPLDRPDIQGAAEMKEGVFLAQPVSLNAAFQFSSRTLTLDSLLAKWEKAEISGKGTISEERSGWEVSLRNLNLAAVSRSLSEKGSQWLDGTLQARLKVGGALRALRASGGVEIKGLVLVRQPLGAMSGNLRLEKNALRAALISKNRKSTLLLEAQQKGEIYLLKQLRISLAGGEKLRMAGSLGKSGSDPVKVALAAERIPTSYFAPFAKPLAHIRGRLSFNGTLSGSRESPLLKGTLRSGGLNVSHKREQVTVASFTSKLLWNRSGFELTDCALDKKYSGFFKLRRSPGQEGWEFDANVHNGHPLLLFALMNAPTEIGGSLNGKITLVHKKTPDFAAHQAAWLGECDLTIGDGHWGDTAFTNLAARFAFRENELTLEKIECRQAEGGRIFISARAGQTALKNPLTLSARAERFILAGNRISGNAAGEGELQLLEPPVLGGKITSADFNVNGLGAGALTLLCEMKYPHLTLPQAAWGGFFTGSGRLIFGQGSSPKIEGEWRSQSKDAEEWRALFNQERWPLAGAFTLDGRIGNTLEEPRITLNSNAQNLRLRSRKEAGGEFEESEGFSGAASAELSKKIFKSLSARLTTQEGGRLNVLGQVSLRSREMSLETTFDRIDPALFLRAIGVEQLKSAASGRLNFRGAWNDPEIKGEILGGPGTLGTIRFDSWEAAGSYHAKEIALARLNFLGRRGSWRFSILEDSWIRPFGEKGSGSYRLAADFANITLGPATLVGSGVLEGNWRPSDKKTSGAVPPPLFRATARLNDCSINNFEMEPAAVKFELEGKELRFLPGKAAADARKKEISIRGGVDFSQAPCLKFQALSFLDQEKEIFYLDGDFCPEKPNFRMRGSGSNAALLSAVLNSPLPLSGEISFQAAGSLRNGEPSFAGELSVARGRLDKIPLDRLEAKFSWTEGLLSLPSLSAQSKELYKISAKGRFPMGWGERKASRSKLDLSLRLAEADLKLLDFLESDLVRNARGRAEADLSIQGNLERPRIGGRILIREGEFDSRYLGRKAQHLNADVKVESNQVRLEEARAQVGSDRLLLGGTLRAFLEDGEVHFDDYKLSLRSEGNKGIPILVPELPLVRERFGIPASPSKGSPRFSLTLSGKREAPKIAGWMELEETLFSYPPPKKARRERSWLENAALDLVLKSAKETIFQNDFAHVRLAGELKLAGPAEDLEASGRVTSDDGTITLYGDSFALREAALEIAPPPALSLAAASTAANHKNVVYLQFRAERSAEVEIGGNKVNDTITLKLERTPLSEEFDPKKLSFSSLQNPELSSERVASRSRLFFQQESLNPEEKDLEMRKGIARLLDAQLATPLARSILQKTRLVDKVEISQDAATSRTEEVRGSQSTSLDPLIGQSLLLEKTLFGRVGVGYRATFDRIKDRADFIHQLQLRYPFYKGLWLYGSMDLDSRENLGTDPDRRLGIRGTYRFDPADLFWQLFKSKKKKEMKK